MTILGEYVSARATPELVGREEILEQIRTAIDDKEKTLSVFYITAPGGWGKTRLVDAVIKKTNAKWKGEESFSNVLVVSRLVDLYHTYTHSEEGIIADIVQSLDDDRGKRFEEYKSQRAELDRVKYDLSQILHVVAQQRSKMMEAFLEDFNGLGNQFDKVVLAFDTVENLTYETDRVQQALGLAEEPIGVGGWLVREFLPKIRNTVVLIAGRPETPQLQAELEQLEQSGKIRFTHIALETFTEAETLAYFEAVEGVARRENPQVADRLAGIPQETRKVVHYLSGGQPFLLSLFVDYLVGTEILPNILVSPLVEIKERARVENGLEKERAEFRDAILQEFQRIRRPLDEVIRALSWTPKGMEAELLAWILKRGQPTEEEIEQAREYIRELRDPKLRLSFVKIRDIDNLVFLQDEMYSLMRSLHERGRLKHNVKQTYELIVRYYEERIKAQAKEVDKLQEANRNLLLSGNWKEITTSNRLQVLREQQKLREERARLQSYQVEHVYYSLQANEIKGIQAYYRAAEEAFQSNDTNLWLLLREEMLKFAKPLRGNESETTALKYIDGDIGVRWIKSNIANANYQRALRQIEKFRDDCPDLVDERSFADLSLKILESWTLVYSGMDYKRAKDVLEYVIPELRKGLSDRLEPDFDDWRVNLLTAYAQDVMGYLYRSQGDFARAVGPYHNNIRLWRWLNFPSELASTLNNLSWSLAEIGDFKSALTYCEDGLNLRRQMGHRYSIAVSLNTFGLIETRNGQPERARFRCEQALGIFRDLEQPRGIGLACTALAEALRRMTSISDLLSEEQIHENLRLAEQYAKGAVEIFSNTVQERMRLVEAYIELGCVYREMVRRSKSGGGELTGIVAKGREAFELASQNAGDEFAYRSVDALVNMAWMYYYVGDHEEADRVTKRALQDVDENYFFTRERAPVYGDGFIPWFWVQLGKAYLLVGKMAFDKYTQSVEEDEAKKQLMAVARHWTLSLAYNAQYGMDFRDVTSGQRTMYNCLSRLNENEMQWVKEGIALTCSENVVDSSFNLFDKFIGERF